MKLDKIFLPELKETEIDSPIFIIGHPRSGTSTLQQLLNTSVDTCSFKTWEIIFPSILQRKFFFPILSIMKFFRLEQIQSAASGHEIFIDKNEEDEGIFLHRLDTELLTLFCPWLLIDDKYSHYGFRMGWNDHRSDRESIKFYHNAVLRLLYKKRKKTFVAKCNPGMFRLQSILEIFPDAKIIYIVREPEKSIQSFFSFHSKFIDNLLDEKDKKRYFQAKYKWSKHFYNYFEEIKDQIPDDRMLILSFNDLIANPQLIKSKIEEFTKLKFQQNKTKSSRKSHKNQHLNSFHLSPQKIKGDLNFVTEKYLHI